MPKRLTTVGVILLVLLVIVLGVAWYDGGREEQRLIVQPVEMSEDNA